MHTEKNIAEAIFATMFDIPEKTKDNIKARVDQKTLCDRPKLDMQPLGGGKKMEEAKGPFRSYKGAKEGNTLVGPNVDVP